MALKLLPNPTTKGGEPPFSSSSAAEAVSSGRASGGTLSRLLSQTGMPEKEKRGGKTG